MSDSVCNHTSDYEMDLLITGIITDRYNIVTPAEFETWNSLQVRDIRGLEPRLTRERALEVVTSQTRYLCSPIPLQEYFRVDEMGTSYPMSSSDELWIIFPGNPTRIFELAETNSKGKVKKLAREPRKPAGREFRHQYISANGRQYRPCNEVIPARQPDVTNEVDRILRNLYRNDPVRKALEKAAKRRLVSDSGRVAVNGSSAMSFLGNLEEHSAKTLVSGNGPVADMNASWKSCFLEPRKTPLEKFHEELVSKLSDLWQERKEGEDSAESGLDGSSDEFYEEMVKKLEELAQENRKQSCEDSAESDLYGSSDEFYEELVKKLEELEKENRKQICFRRNNTRRRCSDKAKHSDCSTVIGEPAGSRARSSVSCELYTNEETEADDEDSGEQEDEVVLPRWLNMRHWSFVQTGQRTTGRNPGSSRTSTDGGTGSSAGDDDVFFATQNGSSTRMSKSVVKKAISRTSRRSPRVHPVEASEMPTRRSACSRGSRGGKPHQEEPSPQISSRQICGGVSVRGKPDVGFPGAFWSPTQSPGLLPNLEWLPPTSPTSSDWRPPEGMQQTLPSRQQPRAHQRLNKRGERSPPPPRLLPPGTGRLTKRHRRLPRVHAMQPQQPKQSPPGAGLLAIDRRRLPEVARRLPPLSPSPPLSNPESLPKKHRRLPDVTKVFPQSPSSLPPVSPQPAPEAHTQSSGDLTPASPARPLPDAPLPVPLIPVGRKAPNCALAQALKSIRIRWKKDSWFYKTFVARGSKSR